MLKIYWFLLIGICCNISMVIAQDSFENEGYSITLNIKGIEDKEAYLGYHLGKKQYVQDTAVVSVDGTIVFEGEEALIPGIYFLYTPTIFMELIVKDQRFTINADAKDPLHSREVIDSEENRIFTAFQLQLNEFQNESKALTTELAASITREDSATVLEKLSVVDRKNYNYQQSIIKDYPQSFTAQIVHLLHRPDITDSPEGMNEEEIRQYRFYQYRNQFFDGVNFEEAGIIRTPVFEPKVNEYLDKLTAPHPDSIITSADYLLEKAASNPEVFKFLLATFTNKYSNSKLMGMDEVYVHLVENYYLQGKAPWVDEETIGKFEESVQKIKPNLIGSQAPPLNLLDTLLEPVSLYDIDAKFTVLFFYDPDCGHCKAQTPKMLDVYRTLQFENVATIGINIATDVESWRKFVHEYECDWINGADPYYQSNFRFDYNIVSTPTIYILDENKKILAKRIGVEQVEEVIRNHQKSDSDD